MSTRPVQGPSTSPVAGSTPPEEPARPAGPVVQVTSTAERIQVEVAATKGAAGDGVEVAVFAASATSTAHQGTVEAKLFGVEVKSDSGQHKASLENFSAKVNFGYENPDGSRGGNFGIGATIVGAEITTGYRGSTVTAGLSVGAGAELSVGTRDLDKDGSQEFCARVSAGFATLGLCLENPF